jgi:hypothetical protein
VNTNVCQRWRDKRGTYRPAGETIDTRAYEVAPIAGDSVARAFVLQHHYAGSYPAARFRYGLYRAGVLEGVAVFSHPCSGAVLDCLPGQGLERTELGRFVLLDSVKGNGETFFLARAFKLLAKEGIVAVVSFSDPVPRSAVDGTVVHRGHVGTIYQACNAVFAGRSTARTLQLLPDGTVCSARVLQKIRSRDKGWQYGCAQLVAAGAPALGDQDERQWLRAVLPTVTRKLRHPGNFRYLFGLTRAARKALPQSMPYPKFEVEVTRADEGR